MVRLRIALHEHVEGVGPELAVRLSTGGARDPRERTRQDHRRPVRCEQTGLPSAVTAAQRAELHTVLTGLESCHTQATCASAGQPA